MLADQILMRLLSGRLSLFRFPGSRISEDESPLIDHAPSVYVPAFAASPQDESVPVFPHEAVAVPVSPHEERVLLVLPQVEALSVLLPHEEAVVADADCDAVALGV